MIRIAIFASGTGSNAEKLIQYFNRNKKNKTEVALILTNNPEAGVLKIAGKENVPSLVIDKEKFFRGNAYVDELKEREIGFIVLAGFLWKLPGALIKAYPQKIINIHPALLPAYGGKGMYGERVHQTVLENKDKESGITIHYVDEHYDNGDIVFQVRCSILPDDTPETLANRIHELEHEHYPRVVEKLLARISP